MPEIVNLDGSGQFNIIVNEDYDFALTIVFPVDVVGGINLLIAPAKGIPFTDSFAFTLSGPGNRTATLYQLASTNPLQDGSGYFEIENDKGGGSHVLIFYGKITVINRSRV